MGSLPASAETLPAIGPSVAPANTESGYIPEDPSESPVIPSEEDEPEVPAEDGQNLSVDEVLNLRTASNGAQPVDVITEHGDSELGEEGMTSALLLGKRIKNLAETTEMNMIVYCGNTYVNVRAESNAYSNILGKMYYHSVATVLDTVYTESGLWYHISSGSLTGYVKSEFFVSGAEAVEILSSILMPYATVINDAQRLYKYATDSSDTLTVLNSGVKYRVLSYDAAWVRIFYGETGYGTEVSGYVPTWSVSVSQDLPYAISLEEENLNLETANRIVYEDNSREASRYQASVEASIAASIVEESRLQASRYASYVAAEESRKARESWLAESYRQSSEAASRWAVTQWYATSYSAEIATIGQQAVAYYSQFIPAGTSALRTAIVKDALQYVGVLPYRWGGESLVTGADCSGFLRAIFLNHGINIAHYTYTIAKTGIKVMSIGQARPGDILCYRTDNPAAQHGHVVLYIGGGYGVDSPSTGNKVRVRPVSTNELSTIQNVIGD